MCPSLMLERRLALSSISALFVAFLLCVAPCASADEAGWGNDPAAAPADAGVTTTVNAPCGEALAWSFDAASGTLSVSGQGPMYDWASSEDVPWRAIRDEVTSVVVEEGVTTIGNTAFFGMRYLANVSLPSTLVSIGASAFGNTLDLGQIALPQGLSSIGDSAFDMSGLTSVVLPDSVTQMGQLVFTNCFNLTEATLSAGLSEVPAWTFHACSLLASVVIPEGVQQIGTLAFYGCTNLQRIYIPATVTWIGDAAFSDEVSSTVTVYYGGTREMWPMVFDPAQNAGIAYAAIEFEASGLGTDASAAAAPEGLAAYAYRTDTLPAFYPDAPADAATITTLYDLGGLYVTNVSDVVYGDLDEDLMSYRSETFSFDVYNTLPYDVVVDVYDARGGWVGSARVEGHAGAQPGVTPESLGVSYTDPAVSTLTRVTVAQPSPGRIVLSANPAQSMGTFYENAALFLVAGIAQTYGGSDDPAAWETVSDALVDGLATVLTDESYPFGADELEQAFAQAAFDAAASYAVSSTGMAAESFACSFAEVLDGLASVEMVDGAAVDWRSQIASALGMDAASLAGLDPAEGLGIATAPVFGEGGELAAAVASLCSSTSAPVAVIGSSARSSSIDMAGVEVSYEAGAWDSELPTVVLNVDVGAADPVALDASGVESGFARAAVYDVFCLTADQQRRDLAGTASISLPTPLGARQEDCIVLRRVSGGGGASGGDAAAAWEVVDAAPKYGDFGDLTFTATEAGIYAIVDASASYDEETGSSGVFEPPVGEETDADDEDAVGLDGLTYYLDGVPAFFPDSFGEDELLTNFYDVNGLYVNNYEATQNDDGSWSVSFDVYNARYYNASVDVYDANGTWVESKRIKKYHDIASLWDTGESAVLLIRDLVTGKALSYQADAGQELTEIRDVQVPAGGYLVIGNAAAHSPGVFLYNAAEFLMEGAASIVDLALGDVDYGIVADEVVDAVVTSDAVRDAVADRFSDIAYDMGEVAIAGGVGEAVETMTVELEDVFSALGFDWKGVAQTALGLGEGVFEAVTGPVGGTLKSLFLLSDLSNSLVQVTQLCNGLDASYVTLLAPQG